MTFPSKIFLDSGDPAETKAADEMLKKAGHVGLEGQTTNPSLIAKRAKKELDPNGEKGGILIQPDAVAYYKKIVEDIAKIISGPISIQVLATPQTTTEQMLEMAKSRVKWIPNGVVKFPCTAQGLAAASSFCQDGGPVNMTLTFSEEQAAAVYGATRNHAFDVYLSPFVGRLDDQGDNGMDAVANILTLLRKAPDSTIQVVTSSIRNIKHLYYALALKSDAMTIPFSVFTQWANEGFPAPGADFIYHATDLRPIVYRELSLDGDWHQQQIHHPLTVAGVAAFWNDWQSILM